MKATRVCSIIECPKPVLARDWCAGHYRRWREHGDPLGSTPRKRRGQCSVDGCARLSESLGLCVTHRSRLRRTGTTDRKPTVLDRFDEFFVTGAVNECWEWQGARNNVNYGKAGEQYAHRLACERAHGPAPAPSAVAMHACDNPPCVNPAHLSWGTQSENVKDGWARTRGALK